MNKKRKSILIFSILIVLLFCIIAFWGKTINSNQKKEKDSSKEQSEISAVQEFDSDNTEEHESITEKEENETENVSKSTAQESEEKTTQENNSLPKEQNDDDNKEEKTISFPYKIPGTDIKIIGLKGYDGIYLEDGKDKKIDNVIAIEVANESDDILEYGKIVLKSGKNLMEFNISLLPENSSVLVQEAGKTKYHASWKYEIEDTTFAYLDELSLLEDEIDLEINENNSITVKNRSNQKIPTLRLFYKYRLDSGEYVGGIAYTAKIEGLNSNDTVTITPSHFVTDGSIILMARKYE